jgi:hypothetical protein
MDPANAGVAIPAESEMINPTINPVSQLFFLFNMPHSPFLIGSAFNIAFHMPT